MEIIDIQEVIYSLDEYDYVFQKLFSITNITFTESIPTCGTSFNEKLKYLELQNHL